MKNKTILTFAAFLGIVSVQAADPIAGLLNDFLRQQTDAIKPWDLGGQFRVRYEARENGGLVPNRDFLEGLDNSNDYFLFRTRAHVGWTPHPWITAYVEGRDSQDASDERAVKETDTFDLHQGYLRIGDPKKIPLSLKIGRQEMSYGDERFIGISDWSNTLRSFDAAKLRFENEMFWADAFSGRVVIPRDEHFNISNDYDWFSGLYAGTSKLIPLNEAEFFFLSRNVGAKSPTAITPTFGGPGTRDIYTVGTRWKSLPGVIGNWDYTVEGAAQFGGINIGGTRLDHEAFSAAGTGGYTFKEAFGAPRVTLGYDYGSGDTDETDGKNETFELLFGTNHRIYGLADLVGPRNMHIPRAGASFKPLKDLTISAELLGYYLADTEDFLYPESGGPRSGNGYGKNKSFDSYVGHEIDLNAVWRFTTWGQLQGGYAHFFTGKYIEQSAAAGGRKSEDADWFYLQLVFSF